MAVALRLRWRGCSPRCRSRTRSRCQRRDRRGIAAVRGRPHRPASPRRVSGPWDHSRVSSACGRSSEIAYQRRVVVRAAATSASPLLRRLGGAASAQGDERVGLKPVRHLGKRDRPGHLPRPRHRLGVDGDVVLRSRSLLARLRGGWRGRRQGVRWNRRGAGNGSLSDGRTTRATTLRAGESWLDWLSRLMVRLRHQEARRQTETTRRRGCQPCWQPPTTLFAQPSRRLARRAGRQASTASARLASSWRRATSSTPRIACRRDQQP